MSQVTSSARHPLLSKDPTYIRSWDEWKDRWNETHQAETLYELLHFGFDVPVIYSEEKLERVLLYLEIADCLLYDHSFYKEGDSLAPMCSQVETCLGVTSKMADLRQILAQKAFDVLCAKFFKDQERDDRFRRSPSWAQWIHEPQVLDKIFWFFRIDEASTGKFRFYNVDIFLDLPKIGHVREFLAQLVKFRWNDQVYDENLSGKSEILANYEDKIVDILLGLNHLNLVLVKQPPLGYKGLHRLRELSGIGWGGSQPELPYAYGVGLRFPGELAKAVARGSEPATILHLLLIRNPLLERVMAKELTFEQAMDIE